MAATPLVIPDFRRFLVARFLSVSASISMVVLLGFQVYDVARGDYGMTRSAAAFQLGILGLVQFVPLAIMTPIAGLVVDRFDRRYVAVAGNLTDCVVALVLAGLTWAGDLNLPILFTLGALHGAARSFLGPSTSAIAPNIVPPVSLPRAIAMSSIVWQAGSVIGPAAGGLLFDVAAPLPHCLSAGLLVVASVLLLTVRPVRAVQETQRRNPFRQIAEGLGFVWNERFLLGCITLDLFAVLLGGATAMLPVFARDILQVGTEGLGIMRGAPAIGAGMVAFGMSVRPLTTKVGTKMLWAVVAYGAATIGFGLSRSFALSLLFLVLLGAADMISVFVRSSLVQLYTPDRMRGRVSATSGLAISASNELGEMQSGVAAAFLGATGAVVFGGVGAIAITGLWALVFPELRAARTFAPVKLDADVSDDIERITP